MNLAKQLEEKEGRRRSVYQDSEGWWTIGIGRLVDRRKGGGLSDVEIDFLLDNDIREKTAQVIEALPWVAGLSAPRSAVVIGMAFQMGIEGLLLFKVTLASIRDGRYATAAAQMLRSKWAQQTPARAKTMSRQMETGEWQA